MVGSGLGVPLATGAKGDRALGLLEGAVGVRGWAMATNAAMNRKSATRMN